MTPMMLAAAAGNLEVVDLLLNFEDVDVSLTDADGQTATDIARIHGHTAVVNLLESV